MLEVVGILGIAAAIGAVLPRWWLLGVPPVAVATWVACAAAFGGADRDGVPIWQLASFFGALLAAASVLGLTIGMVIGRSLRRAGDGPDGSLIDDRCST